MNKKDYITLANKAAKIQINELKKIKKVFNKSFINAVDLILSCKGKVIFAGIGKSGLIARKISATFSLCSKVSKSYKSIVFMVNLF